MARRLKASDPIQLRDGAVMALEEAVASGAVVIRAAWTLWQNHTHGNILGLSPIWRRDKTAIYTSEPDASLRRVYGAGFEFRRIFLADAPDGRSDWGEVAVRDAKRLIVQLERQVQRASLA